MKLLELFCGTKSITKEFDMHGHDTFTIDIDKSFNPDICIDILDFDVEMLPWFPDVLWASPPCKTFSVASISTHWTGGIGAYIPKTLQCQRGIDMISKTLSIINDVNPILWFIENPRGVLRKIGVMKDLPKHTVTYCQYGDSRMKPTDIWTNCKSWKSRSICKNGDGCHEPAPRGSKTGTQGLNLVDRFRIPSELCREIRLECENYIL